MAGGSPGSPRSAERERPRSAGEEPSDDDFDMDLADHHAHEASAWPPVVHHAEEEAVGAAVPLVDEGFGT